MSSLRLDDVDDGAGPLASPELLVVEDLAVAIGDAARASMPLQGVHLRIPRDAKVALVGESGCGKSLTAAAILGMLPPGSQVLRGSVRLDGEELLGASERRLRQLRGGRMAIMFQNPRASLNPVLTVGGQIAEVIRIHEAVSRRESRERAVDLLDQMGIPDAKRLAGGYVHQYSGGMAQRAALAMALSCRPELLIADEPTSGLDATLQKQVLELVVEQVSRRKASLLLITHDIGIVSSTCEHVRVMYAGRVMESGSTADVLESPAHPYTVELLRAYRSVDAGRMSSIPGTVPTLQSALHTCPFVDRCPAAVDDCRTGVPELRQLGARGVACIRA